MIFACAVCGYEYDESIGDPDNGITPDTLFDDMEDFVCPLCGADREDFEEIV